MLKTMKIFLGFCWLMVFAGFLPPTGAAEDEAALKSLLADNSLALSLHDGELTGPGADWIFNQADDLQFLSLGEMHGVFEIAQMSAAIARAYKDNGFGATAVELSPTMARVVGQAMASEETYKDFLKKTAFQVEDDTVYPFQFYFFEEDYAFLKIFAGGGQNSPPIWGLDQEFFFSLNFLLETLLDKAPSDEARDYINSLLEKTAAEPFYIGVAEPAEFETLKGLFGPEVDPETLGILDGLLFSNRFYRSVFLEDPDGEGFDLLEKKSQTMRQIFLSRYQALKAKTGEKAKVIIKYGSQHLGRGLNQAGIYDFGNFIPELAEIEHGATLSIRFICGPEGFGSTREGKPYPCSLYFEQFKAFFGDALSDTGPTLIDFRTLRKNPVFTEAWAANFSGTQKDTPWQFDALVVIPNATPSKRLVF